MQTKLAPSNSVVAKNLRQKAKKYKAKSYSLWLAENASDEKIKTSHNVTDASTERALSLRDNKELAGLANSGYAKHLRDASNAKFSKAEAAAKGQLELKDAKSTLGYEKYVGELETKRNEMIDKVFKNLISLKISDTKTAYETAVNSGLTEDEAWTVARQAAPINRATALKTAVSTVIAKTYNEIQAKNYALSIGLSESDANEIANMARVLNRTPNSSMNYSNYYTDYFKNLMNRKK